MREEGEAVVLENLKTGDRESIIILGLIASSALSKTRTAVFMADALGVIHLMPENSIKILRSPLCDAEFLNKVSKERAIEIMVQENRTEDEIIDYLKNRESASQEESQCL